MLKKNNKKPFKCFISVYFSFSNLLTVNASLYPVDIIHHNIYDLFVTENGKSMNEVEKGARKVHKLS